MYNEENFLQLSGIQHFSFCRRQWALAYIEMQWQENVRTVEGKILHENAHDAGLKEKRGDLIIVRAMPIHSRELGVSGECDVVEFHKCEDGVRLYGHRGLYRIYPIEYKKGKPKISEEDILQLTAQTICLEEMFSTVIPEAAIFYGETRRRETIEMTDDLRNRVRDMFKEMHQYYERRYTPKVKWSKSCNGCSLKDICLPKLGKTMPVGEYIKLALEEEG